MIIAVKGRRNDVAWEIERNVASTRYIKNFRHEGCLDIVADDSGENDMIKHINLMEETYSIIS